MDTPITTDLGSAGRPTVVVMDLETVRGPDECGGWGNAHAFGLSVGVTWCEAEGFRDWYEPDASALVAYLARFERIVGFNLLGFDYKVLGAYQPAVFEMLTPKTLDLLADVHALLGKRLSLDALCGETLGRRKTGKGDQALRWWADGRRDLVVRYCRDDVALTRDLYHHGCRHGFIRYGSRRGASGLAVRWRIGAPDVGVAV